MVAKKSVLDEKENKQSEIKPRWYIFRVQTGREDGIINSLKSSFSMLAKDGIDWNDFFEEFSVPKHKVVKYVNGKKVEKDLNAYPGYIFLKVKMTDEIVLFLRSFFRINGFGQMLPQAISDEEYQKMMNKVNGLSDNSQKFVFRIGQCVTICLTPLFSYFVIYLAYLEHYNQGDKQIRIFTALKYMVYFSLIMLVIGITLILIFYLTNLPLGVGGYVSAS